MSEPHVLFELDKKGAEWVVVAFLSGDAQMIEVVESGKSPHEITGALMSGLTEETIQKENKIVGHHTDPTLIAELREEHLPGMLEEADFVPRSMSIRQCGKKSNHGLNYEEGYKTFALINEIEEREAKKIIELYTKVAYPGVPMMWEGIRRQLKIDRTLTNCYGRKRRFMDAWGNNLFRAAYAYLPQSTVVDQVNQGMEKVYNDLSTKAMRELELMFQVHDSLGIQYPISLGWEAIAESVEKISNDYMRPSAQYHGREFFIETEAKMGIFWGEDGMHEVPILEDHSKMALTLEETWDKVNGEKAA